MFLREIEFKSKYFEPSDALCTTMMKLLDLDIGRELKAAMRGRVAKGPSIGERLFMEAKDSIFPKKKREFLTWAGFWFAAEGLKDKFEELKKLLAKEEGEESRDRIKKEIVGPQISGYCPALEAFNHVVRVRVYPINRGEDVWEKMKRVAREKWPDFLNNLKEVFPFLTEDDFRAIADKFRHWRMIEPVSIDFINNS